LTNSIIACFHPGSDREGYATERESRQKVSLFMLLPCSSPFSFFSPPAVDTPCLKYNGIGEKGGHKREKEEEERGGHLRWDREEGRG
jgi:hypothetical protein